jgi:hypothetical protein
MVRYAGLILCGLVVVGEGEGGGVFAFGPGGVAELGVKMS